MGIVTSLALIWLVLAFVWILRRGAEGLIVAMAVPIRVGGLAPAEWLAPVALVAELVRFRNTAAVANRKTLRPGGLSVLTFVLCCLYLASFYWSESLPTWLKATASFALAILMGIALYLFGRRTGPRPGWPVFFCVLLAMALTGIAFEGLGRPESMVNQTFFVEGSLDERMSIFSPRLAHPWIGPSTYFASFLSVLFVVSVGLPQRRSLRLLGLLTAGAGLVLAASWGGIAAAALGVLVVLLTNSAWTLHRRLLLFAVGALAAWKGAELVAGIRLGGVSDNGRFDIYSITIDYVAQRPIVGFGPESWKMIPGLEGGTHSIGLTLALEFGLLGAVLVLAWVGIVVGRLLQTASTTYRALSLGVFAAVLGGSLTEASLEGVVFRQLVFAMTGFMVGLASHFNACGASSADIDDAEDPAASVTESTSAISGSRTETTVGPDSHGGQG